MSPAKTSSVSITLLTPAGVSSATLRRWATQAQRRLRLSGEIAVVIVPPAMSRALNSTYRHRQKPTNVLSFRHPVPGRSKRTLDGEIFLCPSVIRQEAKRYGETYLWRLRMLLEHGTIHLLGLDHQTKAEQQVWSTYERLLQ